MHSYITSLWPLACVRGMQSETVSSNAGNGRRDRPSGSVTIDLCDTLRVNYRKIY
jgi:hypothetical protein